MDGTPGAEPSIHRRRRGWYLLWTALLAAGLAFLAVWEVPAVKGSGHIIIAFKNPYQPGMQVDWWVGRRADWSGRTDVFQGTASEPADPARSFTLPPIEVTAGLRRFKLGYVPRCTTDRVVIRFRLPQEADRFLSYDLKNDLGLGFIGPHRRMYLRIPVSFKKLSQDAAHPTQLQ